MRQEREGKSKNMQALRDLGFAGSLLTGEIKTKSRNLKLRKRQNEWSKWSVTEITKIAKTKEPPCGAAAWLSV